MATNAREAIGEAIAVAEQYGHVEGDHHKAWVIDQMVRALTGIDYEHWVAAYEAGDDGPRTHCWIQGDRAVSRLTRIEWRYVDGV